jgi:arylsulfatase
MKNYYALITQVDEASERIFNKLEKQSILNETLVIFTTDNGVFHGEHGLGKV